jgi:sodium/hydrogen antiporter
VLYLRVRHREAVGFDEFLALGLIALSYGIAVLAHTYGFLEQHLSHRLVHDSARGERASVKLAVALGLEV